MKPAITLLVALLLATPAALDATEAAENPLTGLFCNIDDTCFFATPTEGRAGNTGDAVDRYVDILGEAGVRVLLVCTNARRTNYRSTVWDAYWDGYDQKGSDDQPFLAPIRGEAAHNQHDVQGYRRMLDNMLALHEAGIDYPARMLARGRQRGMQAWITLRMNDVHENANLAHPFHGRFFTGHPEFFRRDSPGYFARALDYAHPEVREFYRKLVVETLDRYDVDGLELDFMREPYLFSKDAETDGGRILTEWLAGVRGLTRDAALRRGHAVRLGVRVPSNPETARRLGLDAVAWAKRGLVDVVVPTPRWATLEFDMPLQAWREQLAGTNTTLAGGLEVRLQPVPGGPASTVSPEQATGAATAVLAAGADAVYLFNYYPSQHPPWRKGEYVDTLRAMSTLANLARLPRRHVMTYRDIIGPGEKYKAPLPVEGASLSFRLPTGPKPPDTWQAELFLGFDPAPAANGTFPRVSVNDQPCEVRQGAVVPYRIPIAALTGSGSEHIAVVSPDGAPLRVVHVEVRLAPAQD